MDDERCISQVIFGYLISIALVPLYKMVMSAADSNFFSGKFSIPPNFDFNILPNKDKKICVVSIFGKSNYVANGNKAKLIDEVVNQNAFSSCVLGQSPSSDGKSSKQCHIEGFYDHNNRTIFLHLVGFYDTKFLVELSKSLDGEDPNTVATLLTSQEFSYAKMVLYMFIISHIVIFSTFGLDASPTMIRFLRFVDTMRTKLHSHINGAMRNLALSRDWLAAGRPCAPRLLFLFHPAPSLNLRLLLRTPDGLRIMCRTKEDHLRQMMRRARLCTGNSANNLFTLPAGQDFVFVNIPNSAYMHAGKNRNLNSAATQLTSYAVDPQHFFLNHVMNVYRNGRPSRDGPLQGLYEDSISSRDSPRLSDEDGDSSDPGFFEEENFGPTRAVDQAMRCKSARELSRFQQFLRANIEAVLEGGGSEEGGGRGFIHFELPVCKNWFKVCHKLHHVLTVDELSSGDSSVDAVATDLSLTEPGLKSALTHLYQAFDVRTRFSENGCLNALPLAENVYKNNLPAHYSRAYHEEKVRAARHVFLAGARGPCAGRYVQKLEEICRRIWMTGRQMCEQISITGHACSNEVHRVRGQKAWPKMVAKMASRRRYSPDSDGEGKKEEEVLIPPEMPHRSSFVLRSACSCGRLQNSRPDPFDYKEANYDFYERLADSCCIRHRRIELPAFQGDLQASGLDVVPVVSDLQNDGGDGEREGESGKSLTSGPHDQRQEEIEAKERTEEEEDIQSFGEGLEQKSEVVSSSNSEPWADGDLLMPSVEDKIGHVEEEEEDNSGEDGEEEEEDEDEDKEEEDDEEEEDERVEMEEQDEDEDEMLAEYDDENADQEEETKIDDEEEEAEKKEEDEVGDVVEPGEEEKEEDEEEDDDDEEEDSLQQPRRRVRSCVSEDNEGTKLSGSPSKDTWVGNKEEEEELEEDVLETSRRHTASQSGLEEDGDEVVRRKDVGQTPGLLMGGQLLEESLKLKRKAKRASSSEGRSSDGADDERLRSEPESIATVPFHGVPTTSKPCNHLAAYPSWSVLNVGRYFSYSHAQGVEQPGFLHGSNFLLPWDAVVKSRSWIRSNEQLRKSKGKMGGRSKTSIDTSGGATVKIFFGFEYECPLGHRFFLARPDRMMKGAMPAAQVKDSVARLLTLDLPLYHPCQCRGEANKGYFAQLMRVHCAVPAAPINVLFRPRVQPGPTEDTPIFTPGISEPIVFEPGELWVARFPFAYQDGERLYRMPPTDSPMITHCRLLRACLTYKEVPEKGTVPGGFHQSHRHHHS